MNDLLFDLFAYDHWANAQWLERLRNLESRSLESKSLLSHIAAVKRLWWKRLQGEDTAGFDVWPEDSLDICARQLHAVDESYQEYLRSLTNEDLVQDAYLRWKDVDPSEVNDSKSYLTTIVTRLCIDHMKSARAKREEYQGPWLPEPVAGDAYREPDRTAELADSLSVAFLLLPSPLTPSNAPYFCCARCSPMSMTRSQRW